MNVSPIFNFFLSFWNRRRGRKGGREGGRGALSASISEHMYVGERVITGDIIAAWSIHWHLSRYLSDCSFSYTCGGFVWCGEGRGEEVIGRMGEREKGRGEEVGLCVCRLRLMISL